MREGHRRPTKKTRALFEQVWDAYDDEEKDECDVDRESAWELFRGALSFWRKMQSWGLLWSTTKRKTEYQWSECACSANAFGSPEPPQSRSSND